MLLWTRFWVLMFVLQDFSCQGKGITWISLCCGNLFSFYLLINFIFLSPNVGLTSCFCNVTELLTSFFPLFFCLFLPLFLCWWKSWLQLFRERPSVIKLMNFFTIQLRSSPILWRCNQFLDGFYFVYVLIKSWRYGIGIVDWLVRGYWNWWSTDSCTRVKFFSTVVIWGLWNKILIYSLYRSSLATAAASAFLAARWIV